MSQGELWRLLTPALIHGSLLHLGVNTLSLYLLGEPPSVAIVTAWWQLELAGGI